MIEFKNVTKYFPKAAKPAVQNLSMKIPEGQVTVLVGPSGCGKTTSMKMINRIYEVSEGSILVDGRDISKIDPIKLRLSIGYVIQEIGLFPHMSIYDNVATVLYEKKWSRKDIEKRVYELLELMSLDPDVYCDRKPSKLSGGQKQRVGVARAMAANPPIMLMDEPFAAVDPITRTRLQNEFIELQEKMRKTIIFVTHDINEAIKMGDKIAVMREGQLVQYDDPHELLQNPKEEFVKNLVGGNRAIKSLSLMGVEDVLTKQVTTVKLSEGVLNVKDLVRETDMGIALTLDDNDKVAGFISSVDFQNCNCKIGDIYRSYNKLLSRYNSLSEALSIMLNEGSYHVAVVDEYQSPLGVVTMEDVFKAVRSNASR